MKSSTQYVEGEETTTLELARMLRGDKELDFSKTFIQKKEAA